MKIVIIMLFFILIIILSTTIRLDIDKVEILDKKIKYKAKIKIYIFKFIKIFQKNITKKNLKNMIEMSMKTNMLTKGKTMFKKIQIDILELNIDWDYGLTAIIPNVYIYAIINSVIAMFISKYEISNDNRKYKIKTNFNSNYFRLKIRTKIEINILRNVYYNLKREVKEKIKIIQTGLIRSA